MKIVIKIGTSSICHPNHHPRLSLLSKLTETIHALHQLGHKVILVSSGAIGMGMNALKMDEKPKLLKEKQALAALGQGQLMKLYDTLFKQLNMHIAQILLTRHDIADVQKWHNACNTLQQLLDMNILPIINENDTISVAEIKFGDNDTLSAITCSMVQADYLFLLTDVECLYTDNPRTNFKAQPIYKVEDLEALLSQIQVNTPGSSFGTGGMVTKMIASRLATSSGTHTIIQSSMKPETILEIIQNQKQPSKEFPFTHFVARKERFIDKKGWIVHGLATRGKLYIDDGCFEILSQKNVSLFAAGIKEVEGNFNAQEAVEIYYKDQKVGKGVVNYDSSELQKIKGKKSSEFASLLGYEDADCAIHRDQLVFFNRE